MNKQHFLLVERNLVMLKNYLLQNKMMIFKHIIMAFFIGIVYVIQIGRGFNRGSYSIETLGFCLAFFAFSVGQFPLRSQKQADFIYQSDIQDYLKGIICYNIIFLPLIVTTLITIPVYYWFDGNKILILFTVHASLVWWFTGNLITNIYKIKNQLPISKKTGILFGVIYILALYFLDFETFRKPLDAPLLKFVPIFGWLLELMSGKSDNMYLMYTGFLISVALYVGYLFKTIVLKSKPSAVREALLNFFDEYTKLKEEKNILRKMFPFLIPKDKETKTSGKYAAALHYRNLCLNSKNKLLGYLDTNSLLIAAIILATGWMNYNLSLDRDIYFARVMALIQGNIMVWIYLLARKEKSVQPDIYFAMIPTVPQQKLNQSLRYGLISVTIPAVLANLLLVLILGCNPVLAIITGLTAPMLYLFKSASIFSLSMFLKLSPKSGYFNFMQSGLNILVGLFIPSIIITILMFGLTIVESFVTVMNTANRISAAQINVGIFLTLFLCYHLSIYGLFYAFFDKIYRKIDFGKN